MHELPAVEADRKVGTMSDESTMAQEVLRIPSIKNAGSDYEYLEWFLCLKKSSEEKQQ
jgi:hypothetical protein